MIGSAIKARKLIYDPSFDEKDESELLEEISLTQPVMTHVEEYHLFRKMNYLKYRGWIDEAAQVRNLITCANMKLASKVARRIAKATGKRYGDLIGETYLNLVIATEKFDFRRGNKFSTYATRVIWRRFGRSLKKESPKMITWGDELLNLQDERESEYTRLERQEKAKMYLNYLLGFLDKRKKRVIVEINGLKGKAYKVGEVGDRLGVSEEWARQLKIAGMKILTEKAKELQNA